ncbi:MAG TPA: IclR family transcriptional regulator [Polyangiaceae bacterium]|nr:IclR family transcriptional regulator [Polyangiaceae bacterium]
MMADIEDTGRSTTRSSSPVPGLERGLDVIECLAQSPEPLTLTELARALGRTVSELQRTVAQLALRAYLARDSRGAYRLSSKLFRLANAHPPFRHLVARALGPMQRFADVTGESIHLGVLSDDQMQLVAQVEGRALVRVSLQVGALQEAPQTVSGRLLLAALPPAELERFFRRQPTDAAARGPLEHELSRIREQGFAAAESRFVHGLNDLGVPIGLPDGHVLGALTTSWLEPRQGPSRSSELLEALSVAARAIADTYEPIA